MSDENKPHREFTAFEKLSCDLINGGKAISKESLKLVKIKLMNRQVLLDAMKSAIDDFKEGIFNNCTSIRAAANGK